MSKSELLRPISWELQKRVEEGLKVLDQARQQLGDQVALRLERARLWASKKGPEFHKVLMDLSENIESFSKADRARLLNGLAIELCASRILKAPVDAWAKLAAGRASEH